MYYVFRRKMGPKSPKIEVPGGPGRFKIAKNGLPGVWRGSRGGPGGFQGVPGDTNRVQKAKKENRGRPPGRFFVNFKRFLVDFGAFLGVPGSQKAGLKQDRFSGSEKRRIFFEFSSKFASQKGHHLNTF